jgi:hypothetical protein
MLSGLIRLPLLSDHQDLLLAAVVDFLSSSLSLIGGVNKHNPSPNRLATKQATSSAALAIPLDIMSDTALLASGEQDSADAYDAEDDAGLEATSFAPIEEYSPLGYNVSFFNATLLNTSAIVYASLLLRFYRVNVCVRSVPGSSRPRA